MIGSSRAAVLVERCARESPGAARLALLVSPAARIEPELLRIMRSRLAPGVDAGAEADLWLGPLVDSRSPLAIVLQPDVTDLLQQDLASDQDLLDDAARVIADVHRRSPPAVALEEQLTWLGLSRRPDAFARARAGLRAALSALIDEERPGLARWAVRALPRLPASVRSSEAAWMLMLAANVRFGNRQVPLDVVPADFVREWLPRLMPLSVPRRTAYLRLLSGALEISTTPWPGAHPIDLPDTDPALLEVAWDNGSAKTVELARLPRTGSHLVPTFSDRLEVRTLAGEKFLLEAVPEPGPTVGRQVFPGRPEPLGATWDGQGVNFALTAAQATRVDVCLFDPSGTRQITRLTLPENTRQVWHGYVEGVKPGDLYGIRVYGRYAPREGFRFNPNKLLIDPYARALAGNVDWQAPVFGYRRGSKTEDLTRDVHDSARGIPKCIVVDSSFDWGDDRPPRVPWGETVIYETHVKGLTAQHPDVPPQLRGTYAGLASPPVTAHLKSLGVTTVELLPVQQSPNDSFLLDRGLSNYWGYNTLAYFAPEPRYASSDRGQQVVEFKQMVKSLHAAGLEVIMDVAYSHTAEGNHLGPTLSFRGIDNPGYYALRADNPQYYRDFSGTGNSLNVMDANTLKLIIESLRYWVQEMHVDGFRFDLVIALARQPEAYDPGARFFHLMRVDPVLSQVKLIGEPWDVGEFGYQVGNLPTQWSEWNGKYRDNVRKFWKGDPGQIAELAYRLSGSSDLYRLSGRGPSASINFLTAHDGFTLRDLVSYNEKHNEGNGEHNQDGANDNNSWNSGVEGPTDDVAVEDLRARRQRSFLATLFLSQGVPMLVGGDECGRTQHGNNNAYCQDNELSWYDWRLTEQQQALLEFTRGLIRFRRAHLLLRREHWFEGLFMPNAEVKDLTWFKTDGTEIVDQEWANPQARTIAMRMAGEGLNERGPGGERVTDDTLLVLFNAESAEVPFVLPEAGAGMPGWELLMDTTTPDPPAASGRFYAVGNTYPLGRWSLALFWRTPRALPT